MTKSNKKIVISLVCIDGYRRELSRCTKPMEHGACSNSSANQLLLYD